jgi:Zn-dependent M16 (insulinase) family peptidase
MKHWAGLQSSITSAAMKYASNLSASQLSVAGRISNSWGGLEYYKAIERIIHEFEANPTSLVTRLTNLQTSLLTLHQPTLVVGGDTKLLETLKGADMMGLASLSGSEHSAWTGQYPVPKHPSQGRVIAAPVAFTSRTIPTVSYTDQQAPALSIAGNLMDNSVLHKRIREQGGAYGGGTGASPLAGTFGFFGFRDPNLSKTLAAFDEAMTTIGDGKFNVRELEEAKLEVIQKMDSPVSPGGRAVTAFGWDREGRTTEVRQAFRERTLAATPDEIRSAVALLRERTETSSIVSFAGKELLERENSELATIGRTPLEIHEISD